MASLQAVARGSVANLPCNAISGSSSSRDSTAVASWPCSRATTSMNTSVLVQSKNNEGTDCNLSPFPTKQTVVGVGTVTLDFLAKCGIISRTGRQESVFPDLCAVAGQGYSSRPLRCGAEYFPSSGSAPVQLRRSFLRWRTSTFSQTSRLPHSAGRFLGAHGIGIGLRASRVRAQVKPSSEGDGTGDKEVQETLVEILRLETGKVRVNEYVEEQAKYLTDIAETANEEYTRIAEEAKKNMDAAGSKVLEEIDSKASAFEEELAAARAQIEADEADLEAFEKDVERARSEGLFFKELYKTVKTKTPEEQQQIKERAKEVSETVKRSAGSRSRRVFYGVLIFLLTLSIIEAGTSGDVQLPKLAIYVLLLLALIVQLTYENMVAGKNQTDKEE